MNVTKPLISTSAVEKAGNRIVFDGERSYIQHKKTGEKTRVRQQNGVYVIDLWINTSDYGPVFGRQGR